MLAFHFHMDQKGQKRPQEDHRTQDDQLVQIVDQNGLQNFGSHLKFQTGCQPLCQLKFEIGTFMGKKPLQISPKSSDRGYGNHKNADQFADGNDYRQTLGDDVFEKMNHKTVSLSVNMYVLRRKKAGASSRPVLVFGDTYLK